MENQKIKNIIQNISLTIMAIIILFIVYMNYPLYGLNYVLRDNQIPPLTPKDRVVFTNILGLTVQRQTADIVYFSTPSLGYDRASVEIEFINPSDRQSLFMGYKDRDDWHYFTKPLDLPLINNLGWIQINTIPPLLFSRNKYNYKDFQSFLDKPPAEAVGIYQSNGDFEIGWLPDYKKSSKWTTINTPLRGSHSFYVFLENEPFSLQVKKRDLNWYEGPDTMKVSVYKQGMLMSESTGPDDGISAASRIEGKTQTVVVQDNGSTPDNGVYRVDIKTNDDTVIDSITTTLSKIVWIPPIFPLSPTTLYTDAKDLTFKTLHTPSIVPILLNGQPIFIPAVNETIPATASANYNVIDLPQGDVIVAGMGFFSLSKDQYFTPFIFKRVDIKTESDLEKINYLITDYLQPHKGNSGYKVSKLEFDLSNSIHTNDTLNWIIQAPGLKKSGGEILIKNITVILHKDPVL
jgi:hypothetical protein